MSQISPIKVLISALRLAEGSSRHLGGNYFHLQHLASALQSTGEVELILLADEHTVGPLSKVIGSSSVVYNPLNGGGILSADWAVMCAVIKYRPHIYHRTNGQLPFAFLPCCTVATIADVNFNFLPTPLLKRFYKELSFRWTTWRADRITCVSNFTKGEVLRYLKADEKKLIVIPHGANILPPADSFIANTIAQPYWLTFGHQAHKNVETCMAAIAKYTVLSPSNTPSLIVVGQSQHISDKLKPLAKKLGIVNRVCFVGRVDDAALHGLYLNALGLLFMSRYEGFGLPILEAMSCGCPVICSNVCSLPEVAGSAALLVSPDDSAALFEAMDLLQRDPVVRKRMVEMGKKRAALFTWSRAAHQTIDVYKSLSISKARC